eukprot:g9508.t1 g9508   contig37:112997-113863(+)
MALSTLALYLTPTTIITLLLCLLVTRFIQWKNHLANMKSQTPFPGIPVVPDAHWLLGHYPLFVNPDKHHQTFTAHATPSGISALWGPSTDKFFSSVRADHCRSILRQSSSRNFVSFIVRHGRRTLGEESIILINGGKRWKRQRKVIQKAFHLEVVKGGREAVGEVADVVVDWILRACSGRSDSGVHDGDCGGRLVGADGNEKVCVEAEDFFKLFALEVFGKVAMGYDFRCFPSLATSDDNGNSNSNVALHNKKMW